ncbi:MAG: SLBB domain-containing protein [Prevotellaceae bacterium]|jgi:protein involved in polysaccharide export with SLBB domain|nr:SLBB domain-containing protein [Prevotellaceae bacterium]
MSIVKKIYLAIIAIALSSGLFAQSISLHEFKNHKVDQLSDQQIADFMEKYKSQGYTIEQVEQTSLQGGMQPAEWAKLKSRIQNLEKSEKSQDYQSISRQEVKEEIRSVRQETAEEKAPEERRVPIFGSSLFNQSNLTFEPNLKLPTPENYQLGPDDELIIDVYGYSENTTRTSVTPEGFIRISGIGQIQVNGLTINQAKKIITGKLASIYTTIRSGETSVSITLGNIRSIKVLMVGEVYRPGTYTLPSVASVFNALNAAGGPNRNGSFRKIQVIRNNQTIATVDIYDFLVSGNLKSNVRLQDQDIIKVEPYQKRIEIEGEVKQTGYFEAINDEKLSDLINFAGGFTTNAYKDRITVFRNTDKDKSVDDISSNEFASLTLQDGDVFSVGKLLDRFTNRVQIDGAVFRPGTYALSPGLTLKGLIDKADGPREDAFPHRGTIIREKDDLTTEALAFNLAGLLNGTEQDIPLKKEDKVYIASKIAMQEKREVEIYGEIKNAGTYSYHDNMTLKDLIFTSGGFKDRAEISNVEVSRLIIDAKELKTGDKTTEQFVFPVDKDLNFDAQSAEFLLKPYDQIVIRPISGYSEPKTVMIEGEVLYPGNYTIISKQEKISDIVKRAGGFSRYAYIEGAYLIRTAQTSLADEQLQQELFEGIAEEDPMIKSDKFFNRKGIVGIRLEKIMDKPGSKWDLTLQEGDLIHVPGTTQTVQINGEVLMPAHVRFDRSHSFFDYIDNAGGFSNKAMKRKAFVIYANGTAKPTKNFLFFKKYPEISPGAKIYIPRKPERKGLTAGEAISLGTSATTLAAIIISLFRK